MPYVNGVASGAGQALQKGDVFQSFTALAAPANGDYVAIYSRNTGADQRQITWEYNVTGGPPANITANLMGCNLDPTVAGNWFLLDQGNNVAGEMRHVVNKPVKFLRVDLNALGAGGATVDSYIFEG